MKTEAVIFDFGNVLGTFNKQRACELLAAHSTLSAEAIYERIVGGLEKDFESGRISDEKFITAVQRFANVSADEVRRIWGDIFTQNPIIEPIVDALIAKKVPLGVLSNTNSIHWHYIQGLPVVRKLVAYGAPCTLSFQVGGYKPDEILFKTAIGRMGKGPEVTLYLDDIAAYVEAARAFGLQAVQYDCSKNPEHISAIMADYGLL